MTPNDLLVHAYQTSKKLVHMMTADLTPEEFAAQPIDGGNSVAWIIGHLANTLAHTVKRFGGTPLAFPAELSGKVKTTRQKAEKQHGIGSPQELLALFDSEIDQLVLLLQHFPAERLTEPSVDRIPLVSNQGELLQFGATHIAMHVGQISLIRRSFGRPPLV